MGCTHIGEALPWEELAFASSCIVVSCRGEPQHLAQDLAKAVTSINARGSSKPAERNASTGAPAQRRSVVEGLGRLRVHTAVIERHLAALLNATQLAGLFARCDACVGALAEAYAADVRLLGAAA